MHFEPGIIPSSDLSGAGWWFFFRRNSLLVQRVAGTVTVPWVNDPAGMNLPLERRQYLGTLDGMDCYSAECSPHAVPSKDMAFLGLRRLFGSLGDEMFQVAGRAFQIMNWDRNNQFCGRCGASTHLSFEERVRICPKCGFKRFPRLSPAVIAAILKGRQILLARADRFPEDLYSVLAGFVEPGESLEECLRREVREEVGIEIQNMRYFGSQPWPFPDSLMIAFTARYAGGEISVDNREIVDAAWFSAENLPKIPNKISVARRLIDWFIENPPPA